MDFINEMAQSMVVLGVWICVCAWCIFMVLALRKILFQCCIYFNPSDGLGRMPGNRKIYFFFFTIKLRVQMQ